MPAIGDLRPGADVGRRARDRPGRRQARQTSREDIGDPHADQLLPGTVPAAGHSVRDDRRQQRFDAGEEGDGERARQHLAGKAERDVRQVRQGQTSRHRGEAVADRVHGKFERSCGAAARDDRDQIGRKARHEHGAAMIDASVAAPRPTVAALIVSIARR